MVDKQRIKVYSFIGIYKRGEIMTDYKKLYHLLFNAITDALDRIDHLELTSAVQRLKDAQIKAEEIVLEDD